MLYGLKKLPEKNRLHLAGRQFLKIIRVLSSDSDAANFYAEIRHQLTQEGLGSGEMDMMITAHSMSAGAILVTNKI